MSSISAKTKTMVQLALLSALIIVLSFTPIGYINLGFISATTIHIPVSYTHLDVYKRQGAG